MSSVQLLDLGATTLLHSLLWPAAIALLLRFKRDLRPEHRAGLLKLALFGALVTGPWASLRGGPSLLDPSLLDVVSGEAQGAAATSGLAYAPVAKALHNEPQPRLISVVSFDERARPGALEFEDGVAGLTASPSGEGEPRPPIGAELSGASAPKTAQAAGSAPPKSAAFHLATALPWMARAAFGSFVLLVIAASWRQWRARRWLSQLTGSDRIEEPSLADRLKTLERQAGRKPAVRLLISPALPVPCTWGLVRPVIGVPERALDELNADEFDAVLAHELAHVARRDAWWHAGVHALLAIAPLHWPARRAARALARATELSADAWAARLTGSPLDLAGGLTKVAGWSCGSRVPVPALAMAAQPNLVSERVEALLDRRPRVAPRELAPFALGALLLTGASAPRVWAAEDSARRGLTAAPLEARLQVEVARTENLGLAEWIAEQRGAAEQTLIELGVTSELAAKNDPQVLPRLHALTARVEQHLEYLNTAAEMVAEDSHPEPRKRRR